MEYEQPRKQALLLAMLGLGALACAHCLALALGTLEAGSLPEALWAQVFALLAALWAQSDARSQRRNEGFHFGLYVFLLWPLVLPWYLLKTRGIRGLPVFLGLGAIYVAPLLLGLVATVFWQVEP